MGGCNNADGGFSAGDDMRVLIRDFRSDERAVASTVGTIMALLVFLTFLSVIVNQYVPIWMKDSEASHMNLSLGQFGGIKGDIDLQMLAAQASADAGTFHIPEAWAASIWRSISPLIDRKSTRLNSSHLVISYAVFCLKKKNYQLV